MVYVSRKINTEQLEENTQQQQEPSMIFKSISFQTKHASYFAIRQRHNFLIVKSQNEHSQRIEIGKQQ